MRARRIVICDFSPAHMRALIEFLQRDPEIEIAGTFGDLNAMLARLGEIAPDLILLDLDAVGRDVTGSVEKVARRTRSPIVILGEKGESVAMALTAGALDAIAKSRLSLDQPDGVWATALRSRIKRLASVQPKRQDNGQPAQTAGSPRPWRSPGSTYRAIGIGASVGGPPALLKVLGGLPPDFALPVLVVQHMAPGFGEGLVRWLDKSVPPPVALAGEGTLLRPGVWMAPDDAHLRLDPTMRLTLDREIERGAHRPSLDVLFESLASAAGDGAVGVVLTGMGRDGADGVRAISAAGGLTIAQDEGSSAVFGMPGAAIEAGADLVLPLDEVAPRLAKLRARRVER